MNATTLMRLLHLGSQALPVGGYSHSQGLESAIERRIVIDAPTALHWICGMLDFSMYTFEVPMLHELHRAWISGDSRRVKSLNDEFIATRESAELRAASVQMGFSMRSLLDALPHIAPRTRDLLRLLEDPGLPCVWSAAAADWGLTPRDSAAAYVWSWAENQVLVAVKTLPMGQSAGQRLLAALGESIGRKFDAADFPDVDDRSNFTPALAILSAQHETQYSRLFRS